MCRAAQGAAIERAAAAAGRAAAAAVAAAEEEGAAAGHRTQSEGEGPENPESGERGLTEEEKRERRCATEPRVSLGPESGDS